MDKDPTLGVLHRAQRRGMNRTMSNNPNPPRQRGSRAKIGKRSGTELTKKQAEALAVIEELCMRNQRTPSHKEVAEAMGLPGGGPSAGVHIRELEKKGLLVRVGHKAYRALRPAKALTLPLVAERAMRRSQYGSPAPDAIINWIPKMLGSSFSPSPDYFLLLGEKNAGRLNVEEGEVVAMNTTTSAREGDIVAAWVDEKLVCGRFSQLGKKNVGLQALNREVPWSERRINLYRHAFTIEGIAIGVLGKRAFRVGQRKG